MNQLNWRASHMIELTPDASKLENDIFSYWTERSKTYDQSPGHQAGSTNENSAWRELVLRHVGPGEGRVAADMACGTGFLSFLMADLGYSVIGIDAVEPMLAHATSKLSNTTQNIDFRVAKTEETGLADASVDVVVERFLVWTLTDPERSFREWERILKPGGILLVLDGDFVNLNLLESMVEKSRAFLNWVRLKKVADDEVSPEMLARHESIVSRVHFNKGARAQDVADMIKAAGFEIRDVDMDWNNIKKAQCHNLGPIASRIRMQHHRYAICAVKPT